VWSPGDVALVRFIRYGQVRRATPHIVVADDGELAVLYVPLGAPGKAAVGDGSPIRGQADRRWALRDHVWDRFRVLRLFRPIELFWDGDTDEFAFWYVNIQEPVRRTTLGFDTDDLVLDLWIEPDGSWRWKDEDELDEAVRLGRFEAVEAAEIRAEGERVLAAWPFPTGWEDWRPDASWQLPQLPPGWDEVLR
jgi:uncharacterized protein